MASASFLRPLPAKLLRWHCAPSRFRGAGSHEAPPLVETIGQEDALEALRLGVGLYAPGYNVFVAGLPGVGKSSIVTGLLQAMPPMCRLPDDRVYVNDFRHPERPRLLVLPRGQGPAFVKFMDHAIEQMAEGIRRLTEDEAYAQRREEVVSRAKDEERKVLDGFERACEAKGFAPGSIQVGAGTEPEVFYVVEGQGVSMGDLDQAIAAGKVPPDKEAEIRATWQALRGELATALRRLRLQALDRQRALEELERGVARRMLDEIAVDVRTRFPQPPVVAQLEEAARHFIDRFAAYGRALLEAAEESGGRPDAYRLAAEEVLREFRVNLLLDAREGTGCPTVIEAQPTWTNLFGQVERDVDAKGNPRTDFLLIRPGSLLRADGGYLILQARDVLGEEGIWEELKRILRYGRLEIRPPESQLSSAPVVLHPDPIPVNVKVLLLGDESTWHALREGDPDFAEIFKVKAAFESDTALDDDALHRYASFFRRMCDEEGRLHLDRGGLAEVAEEGVREAGRRGRLSVRFGRISDLVREADYAARRRGAARIGATDVREARHAAARRVSGAERHVRRAIQDGRILVATSGTAVGQVNGLAVYDFGDHRFGKVARITAAVGAGLAGVVNVERLAELSGSSHDKGVLILGGWIRETFGADRPLGFTASLVFEQSYGGVDGDSATCAEAFAIVSALARAPLRQDLAVTGSMDQHGNVQAVGGVNDKIEGFFDLCNERGLTGTQGVVIPRSNVDDLMLRQDVVDACAKGRFSVRAIDRVEQGLELLTGLPAGGMGLPGRFRVGSLYARVADRTQRLHHHAIARAEAPEA